MATLPVRTAPQSAATQPTAQTTSATTPTTPVDEPISVGGQKLNPKNPKDAELIKKIKSQQGLTEAVSPQLAQQFQTWADNQLATRSRDGTAITMNQVRNDPELASDVKQALDTVTQSLGTAQFDQAFKGYMNVATAAIRKLTQEHNIVSQVQPKTRSQQALASGGTGRAQALINAMDLNQNQLDALKQFLDREQSRIVSTGSPSLDSLLKQIGKL